MTAIYLIALCVAILLIPPLVFVAIAALQIVWGILILLWDAVTGDDHNPPQRSDPRWF